jgi:hypothetical protein
LNNSYFFFQKTAKLLSKSEICSLEIHLVNMGGNIPEFCAHFRSEEIFQKKKKGDPEKVSKNFQDLKSTDLWD